MDNKLLNAHVELELHESGNMTGLHGLFELVGQSLEDRILLSTRRNV